MVPVSPMTGTGGLANYSQGPQVMHTLNINRLSIVCSQTPHHSSCYFPTPTVCVCVETGYKYLFSCGLTQVPPGSGYSSNSCNPQPGPPCAQLSSLHEKKVSLQCT